MNKEKILKTLEELSVSIDILQATTEYYKEMESTEAKDVLKLNDIVHLSLRDSVNDIIGELIDVDED